MIRTFSKSSDLGHFYFFFFNFYFIFKLYITVLDLPNIKMKTWGIFKILILGWPKGAFRVFCKMLWKTQTNLFGQPSISNEHLSPLRIKGQHRVMFPSEFLLF